jgi:hypothetical protein
MLNRQEYETISPSAPSEDSVKLKSNILGVCICTHRRRRRSMIDGVRSVSAHTESWYV